MARGVAWEGRCCSSPGIAAADATTAADAADASGAAVAAAARGGGGGGSQPLPFPRPHPRPISCHPPPAFALALAPICASRYAHNRVHLDLVPPYISLHLPTEFISIFYLFDTDGSGGISLDELQAASNPTLTPRLALARTLTLRLALARTNPHPTPRPRPGPIPGPSPPRPPGRRPREAWATRRARRTWSRPSPTCRSSSTRQVKPGP